MSDPTPTPTAPAPPPPSALPPWVQKLIELGFYALAIFLAARFGIVIPIPPPTPMPTAQPTVLVIQAGPPGNVYAAEKADK